MYCVKCGVELADSERNCPLCGTVAFHPYVDHITADSPYPPDTRPSETVSRSGVLFIMTTIFILFLVVPLLCDFKITGAITWSGYSSCAIVLGYIIVVLPMWFHAPNPVIFVPVDFVALGGFLLYINLYTGGKWFLSFGLPVVGGAMLLLTALLALVRYLRRGLLFVFGGALIALGVYSVLLELMLNLTFQIHSTLIWSVYPLAVCLILGLMLIVIGCCPRLRESLHRKFFL